MIRNNSSITEFEAMTTTQSSRAGSPLPGGFYCYEDGLTSPTRYSPVLVGGGSYSSSTSGHSTSSLPPSPSRVVASCKNCGFSFRVRSPRTTEFCNKGASHLSPSSRDVCLTPSLHSLDCETCFTLFNKSASSPCSVGGQKTAQEIRKSIYEFQNQIAKLEEEEELKKKLAAKTSQVTLTEEEYEEGKARMRLEKQRSRGSGCGIADLPTQTPIAKRSGPFASPEGNSNVPPSIQIPTDDVTPSKAAMMWGLNPTSLFFKSPKPARPQLHAFI